VKDFVDVAILHIHDRHRMWMCESKKKNQQKDLVPEETALGIQYIIHRGRQHKDITYLAG
jgi:hypothetical protein